MRVCETDKCISIFLTHTEVLSIFGAYARLFSLDDKCRLVLDALITDIIEEYKKSDKNKRFLVKIKAKENMGCEIILTTVNKNQKYNVIEKVFSFCSSNNLALAMSYLYKSRQDISTESELYKIEKEYRLILKYKKDNGISYSLREFGKDLSNNPLSAEYTREYGKPIILKDAIFKYSLYF